MDELTKEKINRLKKWFSGRKQGPVKISIFPTNNCNLNCIFCWRQGKKTRDPIRISRKKFPFLVKQASELGVKEWLITGGGEPLCEKDTYFLMKLIKKHNIRGDIITNATLFSKEKIKEMIIYSWDFIHFSIEGPNKKINDYIRGKDSFNKALENIKLLNYWKKKLGEKKPIFIMRSVLTELNYNKINEMLRFANRYNFFALELNPLEFGNQSHHNFKDLILKEKSLELFKNSIKRYKENAKKLSVRLILNVNINEKRQKINEGLPYCTSPWLELLIHPNGSISPCCQADFKIDNLNKKSLKQIWYGSKFKKFRENMLKNELKKRCKSCPDPLFNELNLLTKNGFRKRKN